MNRYFLHIFLLTLFLCIISINSIYAKTKNNIPDSLQILYFQVGEESFSMKRVEGGVFIMGGTREQHNEPISTDLPTHTVVLDAYYIAHTEVTQALWKTVMSEWEFVEDFYSPYIPISYVNWYDCQEFVRRLDSITGLPFRLPTEAEWEFAARGGNNNKGFLFAGSDDINTVSWSSHNSGFHKHIVGQKQPNELHLYDMTGNVSEWCSDWYAPYYIGTEPNPKGANNGLLKVVRGSSFDNCKENSYISRREYQDPYQATNYCGLRLALTLPNEPTIQVKEEPELVKKVKINNLRVKLVYMATDEPYYISEEPICWRLWNKVMNLPNDISWSQIVIGKNNNEWNEFLEKCRRQSHEPLVLATTKEVQMAIKANIIQEPTIKKTKQFHWEKNTRSIQRHRRIVKKAQKWADLIGVQIKKTDDPTLKIYNNTKNNQPRWLIIR